jgi:hypothetical protein
MPWAGARVAIAGVADRFAGIGIVVEHQALAHKWIEEEETKHRI